MSDSMRAKTQQSNGCSIRKKPDHNTITRVKENIEYDQNLNVKLCTENEKECGVRSRPHFSV